jgi:hypothetical protein
MSQFIDYQQRAKEYSVGDSAVPYGMPTDFSGRVTAVWPAIGMVEVEFPIGNRTIPVEQLQKIDTHGVAAAPYTNSSPVSGQRVSVPGAPNPVKVASEFHKKAIYWAGKDRRYKMDRGESATSKPCCPRCVGIELRQAIYKRRDGSSDKLLGCSGCLFLIKEIDIINIGGV